MSVYVCMYMDGYKDLKNPWNLHTGEVCLSVYVRI